MTTDYSLAYVAVIFIFLLGLGIGYWIRGYRFSISLKEGKNEDNKESSSVNVPIINN